MTHTHERKRVYSTVDSWSN